MNEELIFLEPVLKKTIWGGNRLKKEFGYENANDNTGECWGISAHKNGDCKVIGGRYDGMTLSQLWKNHKNLFGNVDTEEFPLLIKIIDAKADLSIQVHPDDEYARINENGSSGKKECWYILDCNADSTIIIGHNAKDKEELKYMIENKQWDKLIREIPIKKGDFFQIEAGTIHAIKGNTLLLETQQSSDITYRVYDYDRLSDGKKRKLHIEKSIDVIKAPFKEEKITGNDNDNEVLISCDKYTVYKIDIKDERKLDVSDKFICISVIEGEGTVMDKKIKKGSHFIIPANMENVIFKGNMKLIASRV